MFDFWKFVIWRLRKTNSSFEGLYSTWIDVEIEKHDTYHIRHRGLLFSRIIQSFSAMFGNKECRILILGLDNAGKTTILNRLQNDSDEVMQTVPTIG